MPRPIQKARTLFFSTSPRSPEQIAKYLTVLIDNFQGKEWTRELQAELYYKFIETGVMDGGESTIPDLSGREKITRSVAPLGFVQLRPSIQITEAGKELLDENLTEELFLRQLCKLQYPSPYHVFAESSSEYNCKPFLEILRLVFTLGFITKDELIIFGLQLINYHEFDNVVRKIQDFRSNRPTKNYRQYFLDCHKKEAESIYAIDLRSGDIKTRESAEISKQRFLSTKMSDMRDYADACVRYLRYTGCIALSRDDYNYSISIVEEKKPDVLHLLKTVRRDAQVFPDVKSFEAYLWDVTVPQLLSDDREDLLQTIRETSSYTDEYLNALSLNDLKILRQELLAKGKTDAINKQVVRLKEYKDYSDIMEKFKNIVTRGFYPDAPVMFEWNTWRAMTMLDGGQIVGNFIRDDSGMPKSSARGGVADIVCDYQSFAVTVEVTLQSGMRQFDTESEPVARHVGKTHKELGKPVYCLFIAPTINEATINHFFMVNITNNEYYGGSEACIIPIWLEDFKRLLVRSAKIRKAQPQDLRTLFLQAKKLAGMFRDSSVWYENVRELLENWLLPEDRSISDYELAAEMPSSKG